jgi:hypothetical protein
MIHKGNNYINIRRMHTVLCTPLLPRTPMYDWVIVHFQEMNNQGEQIENHYPSKKIDFFSIEKKCEAVIR